MEESKGERKGEWARERAVLPFRNNFISEYVMKYT